MRAAPAGPSTLAVEIPVESGNAGFAPGDGVVITRVLGDRAVLEAGGCYHVEGTYRLGSRPSALLAVYATSGEVTGANRVGVLRGEGRLSLDLQLLRGGFLHVSLYPRPQGQAFGGAYFGVGESVYRGPYVPGPRAPAASLPRARSSTDRGCARPCRARRPPRSLLVGSRAVSMGP